MLFPPSLSVAFWNNSRRTRCGGFGGCSCSHAAAFEVVAIGGIEGIGGAAVGGVAGTSVAIAGSAGGGAICVVVCSHCWLWRRRCHRHGGGIDGTAVAILYGAVVA